jgi:hypothetical protein
VISDRDTPTAHERRPLPDDTRTDGARSAVSPVGLARRIGGVARIAAGMLVLASILTQIVDQSLNDAFVPEEYFSYFTIQSSLVNVVVLVVAGAFALRHRQDTAVLAAARMSVVAYAIVTAVVYNALLRNLPATGFEGVQWPNEVVHVWIPLFLLVDWAIGSGIPRMRWSALLVVVVYPLLWVAFTMVRGGIDSWYPYPFLVPSGPDGVGGVVTYVLGITAFVVVVAAVAIGWSRLRPRLLPTR